MLGYWTLVEALVLLELSLYTWPGHCYGREQLPVLWILPFSSPPGWGNITAQVIPAVQLALGHLSQQPPPLGRYQLEFHVTNSKCDNGDALKAFFDAMFYGPKHLVVFGGLCSSVTATIASSLQAWNLAQLAFAATAPTLANRKRYPNLFRVVPSASAVNPALLKILAHYNWKRVGTLTQHHTRFTEVQRDLSVRLTKAGVELVDAELFSTDPCTAIKTLKEDDVRIVIGQFDEVSAAKVFCCAFQLGMFGRKYQWILSGWSQTSWWTHTGTSPCPVQHVLSAMEGAISVDFETVSSRSIRGVSGRTPQEYQREYDRRCMLKGLGSSKFHGFAYDGVWVMAKALMRVMETLKYSEKYFTHPNNTDVTRMILQAMSETDFYGVTGRVMFQHGERMAAIRFAQVQAGREVLVGEYSTMSETLEFFSSIWFKGGEPTIDQTHVYPQRRRISTLLYAVLASLSGLGLGIAISFLCWNCWMPSYRAERSNRSLDVLLVVGVLLFCSFILLYGLDGEFMSKSVSDALCSVRLWFITSGHTTTFGTMFAKMWRIYVNSRTDGTQKRMIPDALLVKAVCALLLVDLCALTTLQIVDAPKHTVKELSLELDPHGDVAVHPFLELCENTHMSVWLMILCVYKAPFVLLSCIAAWKTRGSDSLGRHEDSVVRMYVCTMGTWSATGVAAALLTRDYPNVQFFIVALVIISCCSIILGVVIGPKQSLMGTGHDGLSLSEQIHRAQREREEARSKKQEFERKDDINEKEHETESGSDRRERSSEGESDRSDSLEQTDRAQVDVAPLLAVESEHQCLCDHLSQLDRELEELARQLRELTSASDTSGHLESTGPNEGGAHTADCIVIITSDDINSPDHVRRRLSLQLPILHHAYLPSVGGVRSSYSPPSSPHKFYTTHYTSHRVQLTQL